MLLAYTLEGVDYTNLSINRPVGYQTDWFNSTIYTFVRFIYLI